jgi:broad specificity phosphatase PhoE
MTRLILLRHGMTDWNRDGRLQGQSDPPLNDVGREQARRAAGLLAPANARAIYASDLKRALATASIAAERLKIPIHIDRRLREIHQGEWEGLLVEEVRRRFPKEWATRQKEPLTFQIPGGEAIGEVAERMRAVADEIAERHPRETIIVVAHGLSLAALVCLAQGIPIGEAPLHIADNAQPVEIDWPPAGADGRR